MSFKEKVIKTIKKFPELLVLPGGLLYYLWIRVTGLVIPCVFRQVTGFYCPGCGVTRFCVSCLKGDLKSAFHAHAFIFVTAPLIVIEIIYLEYVKIKGKQISTFNNILLVIYLVALLVFGVVRNVMLFM
ncbi:MAG: DUF2752 domain-containing protein [Lachnospiraceae bacterium]|nr:DUF2752 domain-containing protein [Lachnospiraceae bacterium]